MLTAAQQEEFHREGCIMLPGALPPAAVAKMRAELELAIKREIEFHGSTDYKDYAMVLVCSRYGGELANLFEYPGINDPLEDILGTGSIVYAYTSSSMPPHSSNYSNRVHVDCPRLIPGYITNMGGCIMLDDFTEENGGSYYLPGSHTRADAPSEEEFYRKAKRVTGKAGTMWMLNSRLWHAGGQNTTGNWRHAITVNMCRPYMKQRLDIPRVMADCDLSKIGKKSLQKLGFDSRVPASYEEYYAPPEKRAFKQAVE